ncbi:uncharacterized protein LTHEOB_4515 [Lasiodiplodia theobromae]|uniref:uncharacterized protein n=1 Tax=Lasiodiplodia theobromae TaxID=45133 RepID=UPI0015C3F883|nr:uncharacterized protein LTHEOB_4515 [Lasiodiplodia theobromae]KAF4545863.1 hypothetical protein LTHEOB_4515 [Lasiodiplodia theobromae]
MASSTLPCAGPTVQLRLLDGGSFVAEEDKLHAGAPNNRFRMYDWAFHVHHPATDRHVLWDLGVEGDPEMYSTWVQKVIFGLVNPVGPRVPIDEQLSGQGVPAERVDAVVFSHAHWDHCRPIAKVFPKAKGYFGPGTKDFCSPGHMQDPSMQWDGRFFDPANATENWEELAGPWAPFGPFEKAMDFFGDGSFYVIQAPGHMPGNLCAAARVQGGDWVLLGSDCCHSKKLLDGLCDFAVFESPTGQKMCLQHDIPAAKDTLRRIKEFQNMGAHVALAHDAEWMKEGSNQVLMTLLGDDMKRAAVERIPNDERP